MKNHKRLMQRVGLLVTLLMLTALAAGVARTAVTTTAAPNRLPPVPPNDYGVTTPRDFFGYDIGQDYKLTPWETRSLPGEGVRKGIVDYAQELQRTSPRVRAFQYGVSEQGRPMIMTVITSPGNWSQIDNLKGILHKLADPRQVASDAEAKMLAQQGKAVYWLSPAIHGTERTSPEVMLRLGYELASANDDWTKRLLDNTIVVIEGSINPDGLDIVTDWYYQYKDTFPNSSPPYYNKYINHDNNRDFLGLETVENRYNTAARYEWNPTVYHDLHQSADFLFMYPSPDPTNPAINSITVADWIGYAGHTITGLIAKGWKGAFTYDYSDNWYPGYNDAYSMNHNTMGMIYELQGANLASPRQITGGSHTVRTWYNPAPYTATVKSPITWRLMDAVNLEEDGIRLEMDYLLQNKTDMLYNFYLKAKVNMQQAAGQSPYAFIIPQNGGDNADVVDMINNLHVGQRIEVDRLGTPMNYGGVTYRPGDFVVRGNQPYGLLAKNLLATPPYPNQKVPFDVVSWDYGLLRDVQVVPMTTTLPAGQNLIPVTAKLDYAGSLTGGVAATYIVEHQSNNNLARFLPLAWARDDVQVAQADAAFTAAGKSFPAGTFIITTEGTQADHDWLKDQVMQLGLTAYSTADALPAAAALHQPRVGLYTSNNSTGNTMPEGWVRVRLDRADWSYGRLYKDDIKNNAIAGKYDVIVIPDMTPSTLITGTTSSSTPPEYRGGITMAGVANLKSFVENGGTLVLLQKASRLPIDYKWNIGVTLGSGVIGQQPAAAEQATEAAVEAEADPYYEPDRPVPPAWLKAQGGRKLNAPDAGLYSPGSTVRIEVKPSARVAYGYDAQEASWLDFDYHSSNPNTPFYNVSAPEVAIVATYPTTGPVLLNGYIEGDTALRGKAAMADAPLGSGNIVLLGPNTVYRAQATGDFMFFFNSLLEGARHAP